LLVAFMDLWRFEGTFMVEHWDVMDPLPVNATYPIVFFSKISLSLSRSDLVVLGELSA